MGKVNKKIGIINATFFHGEVTEIVTISLTTDGGFNMIGKGEMQFTDAMAFVDMIADIHRKDNYDAFIMGSYGVNKGVIDAMRDRGLPVLSMQEMFKAIDELVGGDLTKLEPGRYMGLLGMVRPDTFIHRSKPWPKPPPSQRPLIVVPMSLGDESVEIEVL